MSKSESAPDDGFSQVADGRPELGAFGDPIAGLVRAVEDLRRERDEDRALIEELQIALASVGRRPVVPVYTHWVSWVDEWLTVRISRSPQRVRWCHRYAEHPEVAERLELVADTSPAKRRNSIVVHVEKQFAAARWRWIASPARR